MFNPRLSKLSRWQWLAAGAVLLVMVVILAVKLHGGGSFTVNGLVTSCQADPAGSQVVITDPSGKVVATATLDQYDGFSVRVPFEPRYGISVNGSSGTIWETPQQMHSGPQLTLC